MVSIKQALRTHRTGRHALACTRMCGPAGSGGPLCLAALGWVSRERLVHGARGPGDFLPCHTRPLGGDAAPAAADAHPFPG